MPTHNKLNTILFFLNPNQQLYYSLYLCMKLDTGDIQEVNSKVMATVHPKTLCDPEATTVKHLQLCLSRKSAGTTCTKSLQA